MDNIMLNIQAPVPTRSILKAKPKTVGNIPKQDVPPSGFSFTFNKTSKVKAVVARKRAPNLSNKSAVSNYVNRNVLQDSVPKVPEPVFKKLDGLDRAIANEERIAAGHTDDDNSFSLNVSNHFHENSNANIQKKVKLNKQQRLDSKLQERMQKLKKSDEPKKAIKTNNISSSDPNKTEDTTDTSTEVASTKPKPRIIQKKKPDKNNTFTKASLETTIVGQRLVKPVTEQVFTGSSMDSVGLHPHCVKNLADILKITELTKVQQMTIPVALTNKDALVRSQTGSGKTLAYALPIVQKLQDVRPKLTREGGIQALIIVPTRELALQGYELLLKLLKPFQWIVPGYLTGGERRKAEKARLRRGINILVGTPGRLCDHLMHTESFKLNTVKYLVLDEADKLLELGYERDVARIVDAIKSQGGQTVDKSAIEEKIASDGYSSGSDNEIEKHVSDTKCVLQSMLLSATLTPAVQKLAGLTLVDPLFIDTSDEEIKISHNAASFAAAVEEAILDETISIPATIVQSYLIVPPKMRLVTLAGLLGKECKKPTVKILIFMATQEAVNFHHDLFIETLTKKIMDEEEAEIDGDDDDEEDDSLLGHVRFFQLHGSMTQTERSAVFNEFREAKSGVLMTTDVAGRGIDVPEVDLVVQFSPPQKISDYVHRVGRTARAGRKGRAVMFLDQSEIEFVRILEAKRIRISQDQFKTYLEGVRGRGLMVKNLEECASELQRKFEAVVDDEQELYNKACKSYVSWVRYMSSFPKELKPIFNIKNVHLGHYAKSFALREPPKKFAKHHSAPKAAKPSNRLTFIEKDVGTAKNPFKSTNGQAQKRAATIAPGFGNKKIKLPQSITLSTSEFDSGLPPLKKKKN